MVEGDPWGRANAAAEAAGVKLEPLSTLQQAAEVVDVIVATWGGPSLSSDLIRAFQHAGGTLFGARADGRMVGFVLGFLGYGDGLHVHSHMLAVVPDRRSGGVGYALKLAQRADALAHGIDEVRWTYDPLVARNARFNLVRLGALATGWLPRFYGVMLDDINRGDRSDRFEVRWRLASPRVERALAGDALAPEGGPSLLDTAGDPECPEPAETGAAPTMGCTVAVPRDHGALRRRDPRLGQRWREATGRAFRACFEAGLRPSWLTEDRRYVFEGEGDGA